MRFQRLIAASGFSQWFQIAVSDSGASGAAIACDSTGMKVKGPFEARRSGMAPRHVCWFR